MSLSVDGVWKAGVWATTVWADGVWREGVPPVVVTLPGRLNLGRGGGHKQKKDEFYRKLTQDLLARYYALQERTLPPPEVPVEIKPEVVMKPYYEEVGILRNHVFSVPKPDKKLQASLAKLEKDSLEIRKRIQKELDIRRIDQEVVFIAAMLDD